MNTNIPNRDHPRLADVLSLLWGKMAPYRAAYLLALLLGLIQTAIVLYFPILNERYFNFLESESYADIRALIIGSSIVIFVLVGLQLLGEYLKFDAMGKLQRDFSLELADETQRLPFEKSLNEHSADLSQKITHDTRKTAQILFQIIDVMGNEIIMFLAATALILWHEWKVAVVILFVVPLIVLGTQALNKRLKQIGVEVADQEAKFRMIQQDVLQGMETVRSFNAGRWMRDRIFEERKKLNRLYIRKMFWEQAVLFVSSSMILLVTWGSVLAVARLAIIGEVQAGTALAFSILIWRISEPLIYLTQLWGGVQEQLGSAKRVYSVLLERKEPAAGAEPVANLQMACGLSFRHAAFAYPGKAIFTNLNLNVAPGAFMALVGLSGTGKSTIAKVASGLLFTGQGEIVVNGLSAAKDPERFRRSVMYVSQTPYFFTGTISSNLTLNRSFSEKELASAVKAAQADEMIRELPDGYETMISEKGNSLSAGQKQRLAIARALLQERPVYIFDEATSALDVRMEWKVIQSIKEWTRNKGRSLIVISHRLDVVHDADSICVIEKDKIVSLGTHAELMSNNPMYKELFGISADGVRCSNE
ncbi:ABC transporter ATP-binding protein [Cohnella soli]|uniref:ABC transporter ATP-binding protein n=1 Tax=Cohnella soli TaxID=425005 RepID=A0ABW0I496_9BACL